MSSASRPLAGAVSAAVVCYSLSLWFSQYRLDEVEQDVFDAADVAAPSVERLDDARTGLRELESAVASYVLGDADGTSTLASAQHVHLAREGIETALAGFRELRPTGRSDELTQAVDAGLAKLDGQIDRAMRAADAGSAAAAEAILDRDVMPDVDEVDQDLEELVDFNVATTERDLGEIEAARKGARARAVGLGIASLALSLVAAWLAFRALAQSSERERQLERERATREAAEEALRARDEFLSIASHELRTPLTSLHVAVQALARWPTAPTTPHLVRVAERESRRLVRLVNELLDLSRIQSGRLALDVEEVDLAVVAREVCARFEAVASEAKCAIAVAAEAPVVGRWDGSRLDQVVTNLVANALKFGPGKAVEVHVERGGERARLRVRDHGIGFDPGDAERIFGRFERAVSAKHYGGLGLGLYISRRIVEAHGGRIVAEGRPGDGATFTVDLPLPGAAGEPAAGGEAAPSA